LGTSVNGFLLYDAPVYNFEILIELLPLISRKVRVLTILDCCHAGLGTGLRLSALSAATKVAQESALRIQALLPPSPERTALLAQLASLTPEILRLQFPTLIGKLVAPAITLMKSEPSDRPWGLTHLGAVRDDGQAMGGRNGSLYTTRFFRLFENGGDQLTYSRFVHDLESLMPPSQPPTIEFFPALDIKSSHFGLVEQVLKI
jgi:hypothetical protein